MHGGNSRDRTSCSLSTTLASGRAVHEPLCSTGTQVQENGSRQGRLTVSCSRDCSDASAPRQRGGMVSWRMLRRRRVGAWLTSTVHVGEVRIAARHELKHLRHSLSAMSVRALAAHLLRVLHAQAMPCKGCVVPASCVCKILGIQKAGMLDRSSHLDAASPRAEGGEAAQVGPVAEAPIQLQLPPCTAWAAEHIPPPPAYQREVLHPVAVDWLLASCQSMCSRAGNSVMPGLPRISENGEGVLEVAVHACLVSARSQKLWPGSRPGPQ